MIRRFPFVLAVVVLSVCGFVSLRAATYSLLDGIALEGEPISPTAQGLVVRKADGSFAPRVGWTNFTQEALKELVKQQPKTKPFIEPYPEVRCVIVTGALDRVFCAGANIVMLRTSSHAFKVNSCKYTNETRLGIEDASANSGIRFLAAQRHGLGRRLRARARVRRDPARGRPQFCGEPARGPAARRVAGHRRS